MAARILKKKEKIGGEVKMAKVVEMKETEKMEDKLKSTIGKVGKGTKVFGAGFVRQLTNVDTLVAGVGVGAIQGLKYNGSVKRGIKSGLAYVAVLGSLNGVVNVVQNWDTITED